MPRNSLPNIILPILTVLGAGLAVATVLAAMPVGANAYLFASRYDRAVGSTSAAVAASTAFAVVTVSVTLYLLRLAPL